MCTYPSQDVTHHDIYAMAQQALYYAVFPLPFDRPNPTVTCAAINQQFHNMHIGVYYMAKKSDATKTAFAPPNDLKWINRNLTAEEKAHHDTQEKSASELGKLLFTLVMQGYNLRIGWDAYSKCYQANIIPFQPENPNFGYAISARGATAQRAISLLLYKHYAVFNENWSSFYTTPATSFEG